MLIEVAVTFIPAAVALNDAKVAESTVMEADVLEMAATIIVMVVTVRTKAAANAAAGPMLRQLQQQTG